MDYPDTWYHVLSRGNERRDIFYDEEDYYKFLDIVGRMVERFGVEIHAYVLMSNHYHLLLRTKEPNLSRSIQWLGVSYSVGFNGRHQRSGHLFQGRFKSFLIENDRYLVAMCLYVHGNPLRAGVVASLLEYPWSSYRAYADRRFQPYWLSTNVVLGLYGGSRRAFVREQELFLAGGESVLDELRYGSYLGSEEFARECLRRAEGEAHREKPQLRALLRGRDPRAIAVDVLERLGENDPGLLLGVGRVRSLNRDFAVYALYQLGLYRNEEIGRVFGVGYTAVTAAVRRARKYLKENSRLERTIENILNDK
jgi:REP element-mobilizing transposase RayT